VEKEWCNVPTTIQLNLHQEEILAESEITPEGRLSRRLRLQVPNLLGKTLNLSLMTLLGLLNAPFSLLSGL
jgi:hypothetical protein